MSLLLLTFTCVRCSPLPPFFLPSRFVCGSVDPSSVQAGVILRTLLNCGNVDSTDKLDVLEQIQGKLVGSAGSPADMHDSIFLEGQVLRKIEQAAGQGGEGRNAMKRLERTRLGGGDFVKNFPDLPEAERRPSAEVDLFYEDNVQENLKFEKALFEHVEVVVADALRTMGTMRTSEDTTSSSSAEEATKKETEPVLIPKNLQNIERALDGWQKTTKVMLEDDKVKDTSHFKSDRVR